MPELWKKLPTWAQFILAVLTLLSPALLAWGDQEQKTRGITEILDSVEAEAQVTRAQRQHWETRRFIHCDSESKFYDWDECARAIEHLEAMEVGNEVDQED